MSVAMLDITNNETVSWLNGKLEGLRKSLSFDDGIDPMNGKNSNSHLPNVAYVVDSGSFENLPAYFQVH